MQIKETPHGGILSPLLVNIVLNELDWWISDRWKRFETRHDYGKIRSDRIDYSSKYATLRKRSNLKEMWIVRYADDFKIFCKDYKSAQKIFIATKNWLHERLGLEVSPEKFKVTNLRKNYTEFLGVSTKVKEHKKQIHIYKQNGL
ncbi:reverse transcriptase domain-containing protein [Cellulosilyticum ruminicola]|uniref:reverse transcriptase domain-containing protein n=1 Tax=Cellulosilyticum ruminicola TaxID=425254 RepID=UPI0006D2BAA5|nr:reverse transcriptase domain-containing protein [Cellulosilyticum ruminicola]